MIDLLRGAIEWAREQNTSPLVAAWLVAGWLGLRFLAMLGAMVSRTASSIWSRYNEMLRHMEGQVTEARREAAALKAELHDKERDLERSVAMNMLLRDQLEQLRLKRHVSKQDED